MREILGIYLKLKFGSHLGRMRHLSLVMGAVAVDSRYRDMVWSVKLFI